MIRGALALSFSRAKARALAGAIGAIGAAAACAADDPAPVTSPCVAFAKAGPTTLATSAPLPTHRSAAVVRIRAGAGRTYALDADGRLGPSDAEGAAAIVVGGVGTGDFVVRKEPSGAVRAYVARWADGGAAGATTFELVRYASTDDGLTFDPASKKVLFTQAGGGAAEGNAAALAFGTDGLLYVAVGDQERPAGASSALGAILRLDVAGEAYVVPPDNPFVAGGRPPEVWATGVHQPRGLDVDPATGDVWLTDVSTKEGATLVHRLTRGGLTDAVPVLSLPAPDKRAAFAGGHVYRGKLAPDLVGKYVYPAGSGAVIAVDRFGPSGPAQATKLQVGTDGPLGRGEGDELVLAPAGGGIVRVTQVGAPSPVPTSLLATRCWDPAAPAGVPAGAVTYDVTTPLWSDGAGKDRFVVVPGGAKLTARPDGDLVFPVGTIAVKTFAVDGRRVETRLLVQHDLEDWVGYSYAWKDDGSDAELVQGNRIAALPGGKSWYFPSATDCTACHTPAAGYTLGLEAKQLRGHGDALARLGEKLDAPLDVAALTALVAADAPLPATAEARARSYLHANCSMCHREGSATGNAVDLDLRFDTPLDKTGLCREPQTERFGLTDARIVAPHDPARSVVVARMRALDERRMPKLASRVVDEQGVAAVEAWIEDLPTCP